MSVVGGPRLVGGEEGWVVDTCKVEPFRHVCGWVVGQDRHEAGAGPGGAASVSPGLREASGVSKEGVQGGDWDVCCEPEGGSMRSDVCRAASKEDKARRCRDCRWDGHVWFFDCGQHVGM